MQAAWHWQERFQPADVEDACRRQILKIRRPVSYDRWVQQKTRAAKNSSVRGAAFTTEDSDETKEAEIDAAFQDWLRRKKSAKKKRSAVTTNTVQSKPPSLHVNPKTKGSARNAERVKSSVAKASSATHLQQRRSDTKSKEAYAVWLARVRQEDRIRRVQRREELDRLEQQQREKHNITWRKKLVVCAYSGLASG